MIGTTNDGTARTTSTASQEEPYETQARISLSAPKANLDKDLYRTPTHYQSNLLAQLHAFLLQDSPNLTQLNDAENKPVVRIINYPKSSTIRVLHSFGIGTNPIGGSYPISGKIISLVGDVSPANDPQDMVFPRELFHKTSIRLPNQDDFEHDLNNTQSLPLKKNPNFTHEGIVINIMPVSAFLVYDGFDADLDTIIIYRRIKTLDNLVKPAIQALLNFLRGCMTSILINDTGTFIPSNVFIDSTPSASHTWGLNKFNINFPTLFSPHKEPGPTSDPPAASPDININLFQRFLSAALHNPSWKIFTPCAGRKSIFISSYAV